MHIFIMNTEKDLNFFLLLHKINKDLIHKITKTYYVITIKHGLEELQSRKNYTNLQASHKTSYKNMSGRNQ